MKVVQLLLWAGLALILTGGWLFLRPYNDIRFDNNVGMIVGPKVIPVGGVVRIHFDGYCNDGQTNTVERTWDVYGRNGKVITTSIEGATLTFYNSQPQCFYDYTTPVPLPLDVEPPAGQTTAVFRLHNTITYHPNLIRTVTVDSYSEPFTVTTEPETPRTVQ